MKFLLTGLFFGTLLILWGLSLIVESIFGITIPVLRIGFAVILIYAGLLLIKGMYEAHNQKTIFFSQESIKADKENSEYYKIAFGQGTVDLSDIQPGDEPKRVQVYTLFGKATLIINPAVPTHIAATSILSGVTFPDKTIVSLGNYTYNTAPIEQKPQIIIDATAVFSALEVKNS